jgi:hypothetical protein
MVHGIKQRNALPIPINRQGVFLGVSYELFEVVSRIFRIVNQCGIRFLIFLKQVLNGYIRLVSLDFNLARY